jgi:hypothetical protein
MRSNAGMFRAMAHVERHMMEAVMPSSEREERPTVMTITREVLRRYGVTNVDVLNRMSAPSGLTFRMEEL